MNNRQKAKRFKKLYESTLPRAEEKKIFSKTLRELDVKHMASGQMIRSYPELKEEIFKTKLLEPLMERLRMNVTEEYDAPRDRYIYTLSIWVEEAEDPRPWWAYQKPKIAWPHASLDTPKFSVGNDRESLL